jgi:hypothetical protein
MLPSEWTLPDIFRDSVTVDSTNLSAQGGPPAQGISKRVKESGVSTR